MPAPLTLPTLLDDLFAGDAARFADVVLTEARPENTNTRKATGRKVAIKNKPRLQIEHLRRDNKAVHENVALDNAPAVLAELLETEYKQGIFRAIDGAAYHVTHDKNDRPHIRTTAPPNDTNAKTPPAPLPMHDRRKNYLIETSALGTGQTVPFLMHLGVQTRAGDIKAGKNDKFKQINRFLEMVDDVFRHLPANGTINVVDFGCGKSYLTFALHHYLTVLKKRDVQIVGLDLKPDVVRDCNAIAQDLHIAPDTLRFVLGDIAGQGGDLFTDGNVHLVVSLHACDTATDDAIIQAVQWKTPVLLSVPCCQHELNHKIENASLRPLLKHGLLKERVASLVTDALRAHVLEIAGYDVQVLEFIDMEHTPKNILLRAVRKRKPTSASDQVRQAEEYGRFLCGMEP